MCWVLFQDFFGGMKALFWEGASCSLHAELFTLRLWEGTVCTCPFTTCLVKSLRILVSHTHETCLCQDCAWQLRRTIEHTNSGFCCVLALTAQYLLCVLFLWKQVGIIRGEAYGLVLEGTWEMSWNRTCCMVKEDGFSRMQFWDIRFFCCFAHKHLGQCWVASLNYTFMGDHWML